MVMMKFITRFQQIADKVLALLLGSQMTQHIQSIPATQYLMLVYMLFGGTSVTATGKFTINGTQQAIL